MASPVSWRNRECYEGIQMKWRVAGVWGWSPGGGGGGGGGGRHCLFEGKYLLPNYCPCFSVLSAPQFFLTAPLFLRVINHSPTQKSNILDANLSTKVIQNCLHTFLHKKCHLSHKTEGIQTSLISYCSQFEVDRPPVLPQKELTAPTF